MNKKRKIPVEVSIVKKSILLRFLQLKVRHLLSAVYLEKIKKKESEESWWCQYKRQMTNHLFK
jgi:hypothetical protein